MGFFKSLREVTTIAADIQRQQPPAEERMAGAIASLQGMHSTLAELSATTQLETELRATGVRARGMVTAVRGDTGEINGAPILDIDVLVQVEGQVPRPATLRATVPVHLVHRVAAGSQVPVLTDPATGRTALDGLTLATEIPR